jgi:hypothetical protein
MAEQEKADGGAKDLHLGLLQRCPCAKTLSHIAEEPPGPLTNGHQLGHQRADTGHASLRHQHTVAVSLFSAGWGQLRSCSR